VGTDRRNGAGFATFHDKLLYYNISYVCETVLEVTNFQKRTLISG
jgi:hypothetical protein